MDEAGSALDLTGRKGAQAEADARLLQSEYCVVALTTVEGEGGKRDTAIVEPRKRGDTALSAVKLDGNVVELGRIGAVE